MSWLTGERTTRAVLVAVALGAIVMVTIGAGYRGSHALLEGAGAFLQKGHTVVHVNAESGETDAEVAKSLATGRERLEVVQVGPDSVWVVNNTTGEVWRLPTSDMKPEKVDKLDKPKLVSNGGHGYLVDAKRGTLTALDSRIDRRVVVRLPAPASQVVVDSRGTAWAYSNSSGELYEVAGGRMVSTVKAAEPKENRVGISLIDDRPVIYRATVGEVKTYGSKAAPKRITLPKVTRPVEIPNGPVDSSKLVWVVSGAGILYSTDVDTGDVRKRQLVGRESHRFGQPVVLNGRVYVPDQTLRQVVVVDLESLEILEEVDLPSGKETFEVFVRDGRVWVNDPYAQTMLVFDRHGKHTVIDKGTGDGIDDENPRKPKPTSKPTGKPITEPTTRPTTRPGKPPITLPTEQPTDRPVLPKPIPTAVRPTRPAVTQKPPRMVTVPSFPSGTKYDQACADLRQLGLVCNAVAAGEDSGLAADEVIDTRPAAGTEIAVGKPVMVRYVGPEKVPQVTGRPKGEACSTIEAANLSCQEGPEPDLARQASELLVVNRQDPGQGQEIDRGGAVSVFFRNKIKLPSFSGTQTDACRQVSETYHMTCAPVTGDPRPGECTRPGHVYKQQPAVGRTAQTASRVTLTICPGQVPVDNYMGLLHNPNDASQQTACARIVQQGFTCNPVKGRSPNGVSGAQPYVVYAQDPAHNSKVPPGSSITVTYYSNEGDAVGNYDKANADAACAEIRNKGYQCQGKWVLHRDTSYVKSAVVAQDPAPGTYPIGTMFTLSYQEAQPVELFIYRHDTSDTWAMATERPAGFNRESHRIGLAYPPGTPLPTGVENINGWSCSASLAACNGRVPNFFYSQVASYEPGWSSWAANTFLVCKNHSGSRPVYRIWKGPDTNRTYGIAHEPRPAGWGAIDSEELGCVW